MRGLVAGALALCFVPAACEGGAGGDLGVVLGDVLGGIQTGDGQTQDGLSTFEIDAALRQACLDISAIRADLIAALGLKAR